MKSQKTQPKTTRKRSTSSETGLLTLSDHLSELRARLLATAAFFVLACAVAYPFYKTIMHWLLLPLGGEKLYFNTPAGGISFIIKICMYSGLIAILPVITYQLYKFIAPVMARRRSRTIALYTVASFVLAVAGVLFAYFISLPAALHFLTGIQIHDVSALITVDAYVSFVTTYLLAGALLFQVPLIMVITNSITPLPPPKLMSFQRYNIVASFIIAALITPTPDVVNQSIIAVPMIGMYQVGVILIWLQQRRARRLSSVSAEAPVITEVSTNSEPEVPNLPTLRPVFADLSTPRLPLSDIKVVVPADASVSGLQPRPTALATGLQAKNVVLRQRADATAVLRPLSPRRSIDGFFAPVTAV